MLDKWILPAIKKPLDQLASKLAKTGVTANQVTVAGFLVGLVSIPFLAVEMYFTALGLILFNRLADGVDGALARQTSPTDVGGFLDISLDFIFYAGVVFGFALADPAKNGLAAAALLFSFVGTGCTFLAFGIMAERRSIRSVAFPNKGFYYLVGIAEGTETIGFFVLCCLLPTLFPLLAWIFACICWLSAAVRLFSGYLMLK